jgi:Type II secretion system (T2SS), protein K
VTVYTREPNFHSDGTLLTNVNSASDPDLEALFQNAGVSDASGLATRLYDNMHAVSPTPRNSTSGMMDFCLLCKTNGMSSSDFAKIYDDVTTSTNTYIYGRVNVNTASVPVLEALFMGLGIDQQTASGAAQSLLTYREQNPNNLASIAWVIDALGTSSSVVNALATGDYVTSHSYQFTADIAAIGPFGRGYRRVKFIFDTSDGTPKIIYRQDLTRLGWGLGEKVRETWVTQRNNG